MAFHKVSPVFILDINYLSQIFDRILNTLLQYQFKFETKYTFFLIDNVFFNSSSFCLTFSWIDLHIY